MTDQLEKLRNYANGDEYQRAIEWAVDEIEILRQRIKELDSEQGEPVYQWCLKDGDSWEDISSEAYWQAAYVKEYVIRKLYAASPNTQAAVAAFAMNARRVCSVLDKAYSHPDYDIGVEDCINAIRSIPHDESALVEFGMKVAKWMYAEFVYYGNTKDIPKMEEIVQRVIKGE